MHIDSICSVLSAYLTMTLSVNSCQLGRANNVQDLQENYFQHKGVFRTR